MNRYKKFSVVVGMILLVANMVAATPKGWSADSIVKADVDPVITTLDSLSYQILTRDKFFTITTDLAKYINLPTEQLPHFTDAEVEQQLRFIPSAVPLDYNKDVRAFIDLFVYKRRGLISKMRANSQIYFPLFEQILDRKKMPDELKYLPIVESALNPQAVSRAGATGLWQLMHGTGKQLGCDVNSYIDERRDPIVSTEAGTEYLYQMYRIYGDWQLALAAYNSGPGNVNKAIARAGGVKNFWAIKNYLPAETRSYVPTFIAVVYAMKYADTYKIFSAEPSRDLYALDTVHLDNKVTMQHIASTIGIPLEEIQFLNPSLKTNIVPRIEGGFPLNLPVNYLGVFETKREVIANDPEVARQEQLAQMYINPTYVKVTKTIYHVVRKNETIASIAKRYGVSASELKKWNRLGKTVARGQKLKVNIIREVPVYQQQHIATNNQSAVAATPSSNENQDEVVVENENNETAIVEENGSETEDSNLNQEEVVYYYEKNSDGSKTRIVENNTSGSILSSPLSLKPTNTTTTNHTVSPAKKTPTPAKPKAVTKTHKVRSGDTLSEIANKYGTTVSKIKSLNGMKSNSVKIGQVLKVK